MNIVQLRDQSAAAGLLIGGRRATVFALCCGFVTIKKAHHQGVLPESTPAALRFAAILADRRFAAPMPIWCYVIRHPAGTVVIDTGADPAYADRESWKGHHGARRFLHSFLRVRVEKGQNLIDQMGAAGLAPRDVQAVVLTHQHIDHTGNVRSFPHAELWTTRAEDDAARTIGAQQWRWRQPGQRIRYVDDEGHGSGEGHGDDEGHGGALGLTQKATVDLFDDGSLKIIHTPGHTPGSVTVTLTHDHGVLWFTGDTSFTAEGMDPAAPTAGIHSDMAGVRGLHAALTGLDLFPSHDPGVAVRLRSLDHTGSAS